MFRILCVVFGIFTVMALYRLRVRQIARSISTRFDERLAERTRMARDLHDTFLQTIEGSKLVADDALEASTDPIRMRRAMEQLSVRLSRAMHEGRTALNSLRTAILVPGGIVFRKTTPVPRTLFTKIRALFKRTDRTSDVDCTVSQDLERPLSALLGAPKQRQQNDSQPTVFCGIKHFVEIAAAHKNAIATE